MPRKPKGLTLSSLLETRQALHLACIPCGRERYLSGLEAVASYGGLITFAELRAVLHARCSKDCKAVVEPYIRQPDELVVKKRVP